MYKVLLREKIACRLYCFHVTNEVNIDEDYGRSAGGYVMIFGLFIFNICSQNHAGCLKFLKKIVNLRTWRALPPCSICF